MRFRLLAVAATSLLLGGCLVDLYGGNPRLQCKNSCPFVIRSVGIGDLDRPTWKHDFDPLLKTGKSSEVIELPVAGDFQMWIRISDTASSWDMVLTRQEIVDVGDFRLVEVSGDSRSNLSTTH